MKEGYSDLRRNTIIIAIATIGSKAITFILAPLYSFFLSTKQYGTMELIITTASLMGPLLCLDIYEATFRFTKDGKYDKNIVISSSLSICIFQSLLMVILFGIASIFMKIPTNVGICVSLSIIDSFLNTILQYARSKDKIGVFAFSGVLNAIILLVSNIVLLVLLKLELTGWMISFFVAKIVVLLYLCFTIKIWRDFSFGKIDKSFLKTALKYCLPLMPSASMWWIMNASDRYILTFYFGVSLTGIYAVGNKLPLILSIFENIFYQAWQTTAIDTAESEDCDKIYSNIFMNYFLLLCIGVLSILIILKPMIFLLFIDQYHSAWICAAVLVVGVMLHALGGNLGTLYTVFKYTKGVLKTSMVGAIVNIVLNFIFIPKYGMIGAATTTLVGYTVVFLIRWFDARKFVHLVLPIRKIIIYSGILVIQFVLYYVSGVMSYIIRVAICIGVILANRNLVFYLIKRKK